MPYNTLVQRSDVTARIPDNVSNAMLTTLRDTSAALALGTRIGMPAGTTRFPVLSALPTAYWVTGDTGLKQTTTAAWAEKFINVEELAAIVPIPESVMEDSGFDVWGELRPLLEAAISRAFDSAVFLGVSAPAGFPTNIAAAAAAAGNSLVRGTATAEEGGVARDISNLIGKVEEDGYSPDGGIARTTLRGLVRNLQTIPEASRPAGAVTTDDWFGANMRYPMRGLWPTAASSTEAIVGDFDQLVVGVRRDFDYRILTEGVITDAGGLVVYNLPQQDMIALRVTFRAGWQISNPLNYDQPVEANRYPFARLVSPA
jgi:hypothetical protein